VIISVGYRVNSAQATQFRIWATQTLREFIVKGFVLDDERMKLNTRFGNDYFDELLERIREIRASERRFYLKISDIYEQCSIDYDKHAETTQTFFKTVQNKLHWVVTGKTAAELIATDPETGHRYTVKRYESEKAPAGDSWRHTKITLKPTNPAYAPIVLEDVEVDAVQAIAELVEVLGTEPAERRGSAPGPTRSRSSASPAPGKTSAVGSGVDDDGGVR
jgi:Virulence protein RhuM family